MQNPASEILISAHQVTCHHQGDVYEFVMNEDLRVLECVKIESLLRGIVTPIRNAIETLDGFLFELNHVRVNPSIDNTLIIDRLTHALNEIGVKILNAPHSSSMANCYKPLGEISHNLRFYLNPKGNLIFLSPASRPKLVYCQKTSNVVNISS